jgi:hypothetical protein
VITSEAEFIRLRESESPEEYRRAVYEEAPLEVWLSLVESSPSMRVWVAQNKTVPLQVLEILARDADARVRSMVASKRKLTPQLQLVLAADLDDGVRARLAHNAKATLDALQRIADGEPGVATRVAMRKLGIAASEV